MLHDDNDSWFAQSDRELCILVVIFNLLFSVIPNNPLTFHTFILTLQAKYMLIGHSSLLQTIITVNVLGKWKIVMIFVRDTAGDRTK